MMASSSKLLRFNDTIVQAKVDNWNKKRTRIHKHLESKTDGLMSFAPQLLLC
jgi:hypothetical protein